MAQIIPFRGIRYDPAKVGDIGRVISPPYDVIDPSLRRQLFAASPYNIAHIIKTEPDISAPDGEQYRNAAELFQEWLARGILKQDELPAIYIYQQKFSLRGEVRSRTGIIALVRLEELGSRVIPHEHTLSAPKADRLNLLRATRAHFGQVFCLYSTSTTELNELLQAVTALPPLTDATDLDGIGHRLWAITDPKAIRKIQAALTNEPLFIADGHHRYETALNYSKEHPGSEAARYCMMTLVSMADPGLVILPTHRMVKNIPNFSPDKFLRALEAQFDVRRFPQESRSALSAALREADAHNAHAFGLYMNDGNYYLLTLRDISAMADIPQHSHAWRELDVAILHTLVFERILGMRSANLATEQNLEYVKDNDHAIEEAIGKVKGGLGQALFFMNATRLSQVVAVARAGEKMPQKSTFFYPKVYSGVVIYKLT